MSNNTKIGTVYRATTPRLALFTGQQHQDWHCLQGNNIKTGTVYRATTPRLALFTGQQHQDWHCLQGINTKTGTVYRATLGSGERSVSSNTKTGTAYRATLGRLLRDSAKCVWAFQSVSTSILSGNWKTELKVYSKPDFQLPPCQHFLAVDNFSYLVVSSVRLQVWSRMATKGSAWPVFAFFCLPEIRSGGWY